jgi:photosystem II stability/assembly factor-like uncharacterized protein
VIEFVSESTGFIADYDGGIFKTTDGGNSWKQVASTALPFFDTHFVNANEGWAVGGNGSCYETNCIPPGAMILHTVDAGETWTRVNVNTANPMLFWSVWFVNQQLGFAVGGQSILRTTDGGETWNETTVENPGADLLNVRFFDENNGMVTGIFDKVFITKDGGENWEAMDQYDDFSAYVLDLAGDGTAFSSGDKVINRSTDFGETWTQLYTFSQLSVFSLNFISKTTGFALGPGEWSPDTGGKAGLYYTTDGGQSWKGASNIHEVQTISKASFPTANVGYGLCFGKIMRIRVK